MRASIRSLVLAVGLCLPVSALAQPATEGNLGTVTLGTPITFNTGGTAPGQVKWWTFTLAAPIRYQDLRHLDVFSANAGLDNDCEIAVYNSTGVRIAADDDDGVDFNSLLTFGTGNGGYTNGASVFNGRDGDLPAGVYYLAVSRWQVTYNATGWSTTADASGFGGDAVDMTIAADDTIEISPPGFSDLGDMTAGGTTSQTDPLAASGVNWYRVELPAASVAAAVYADIDTEGSLLTPTNATRLTMYGPNGALQGTGTNAYYTDLTDGSGTLSQLTFGVVTPNRPAVGDGLAYNGRDGALRGGIYYIALTGPTTAAPSVFSPVGTNFSMSSTSTNSGTAKINLNVAAPQTDPSATGVAVPSFGQIGSVTVAKVTVVPGGNPTSSGILVSLNTGGVDGGVVNLLDNGAPPDAVSGDKIFSGNVTVGPGAGAGPQTMIASVIDGQLRTATANVNFTVVGPAPACPSGDETHSFTALDSEGALGAGTNSVVTFNSAGAYSVATVRLTGRYIANDAFGADTRVQVTAPGGEEFTFAPLGGIDPTTGVPTDVAVELNSQCGSAASGTWTVRVFENINDGGVPDGVWANLCIGLVSGPGGGSPDTWRGDACDGDAGEMPGTAQVPTGSGPFNSIVGSLPVDDVDMYQIEICDTSTFSATTDGSGFDTQLWLFNPDGTGVIFNDDSPGGGIGVPSTLNNSGGQILTPGTYLLAVTAYDTDPYDVDFNYLWANTPFDTIRAPDGLGAANPLIGWDYFSFDAGNYTINLTGVCYPGGGGGGCNIADITEVGGTVEAPGAPDNQLTVDDIIVFVNAFGDGAGCPGVAPCNIADICEVGGTVETPGAPDGQLTVDDLIVFFNAYSDGCV